MTYTIKVDASSMFVAWGPPYTPSTSAAFVRAMSERSPHAKATELCRSREGRAVPMLHVREGERTKAQRFGVWVQARQHAWESGSSWVAQGFGEWLLSDDADAEWRKVVAVPGEVKLGAPYENPPVDRKSFNPNRMFGVAAKALR